MENLKKIGLGGGCHWCTEAVFQALKGVGKVEQGYISSFGENSALSEAVIVHYNDSVIVLKNLIDIHLQTHASTSQHSFRNRYRSAIYFFDDDSKVIAEKHLVNLNKKQEKKYVTKVLKFNTFEASREAIQDYFKKNPEAPFCERYIKPKLDMIDRSYLS